MDLSLPLMMSINAVRLFHGLYHLLTAIVRASHRSGESIITNTKYHYYYNDELLSLLATTRRHS